MVFTLRVGNFMFFALRVGNFMFFALRAATCKREENGQRYQSTQHKFPISVHNLRGAVVLRHRALTNIIVPGDYANCQLLPCSRLGKRDQFFV